MDNLGFEALKGIGKYQKPPAVVILPGPSTSQAAGVTSQQHYVQIAPPNVYTQRFTVPGPPTPRPPGPPTPRPQTQQMLTAAAAQAPTLPDGVNPTPPGATAVAGNQGNENVSPNSSPAKYVYIGGQYYKHQE